LPISPNPSWNTFGHKTVVKLIESPRLNLHQEYLFSTLVGEFQTENKARSLPNENFTGKVI
jgi:hypothetical protein